VLNVTRNDPADTKTSTTAVDADETAEEGEAAAKARIKAIDIPRDSNGNVMYAMDRIMLITCNRLPLPLGSSASAVTLVSLGTIISDPAYHTSRNIYPVGFKTTRLYSSTKNPDVRVLYVPAGILSETLMHCRLVKFCRDLKDLSSV